MIYKYKLYRTVDHWESIETFYEKKIRKWVDNENITNVSQITLADLLQYQDIATIKDKQLEYKKSYPELDYTEFAAYALTNAFVLNSFGGEKHSIFLLGTRNTANIFLDTKQISDQIVNKNKFAIFIALIDTFRFFRYYLRESGLFKTLISNLGLIAYHNKDHKYLDESSTPCENCTSYVIQLLKKELDSIHDIETYCLKQYQSCTNSQDNCLHDNLIKFLSAAIYQYQQLIKKELEGVDLNLLKISNIDSLKSLSYSSNNKFAFIPRYLDSYSAENISDIMVVFKNNLNQLLVYKNKKIYCPFSHLNSFTNNDDKCKAVVPKTNEPIYLTKIIYNNNDVIDEASDSIFSKKSIYIAGSPMPDIKSFRETYCRSSVKKINIDRSKLESINVKRDIRR